MEDEQSKELVKDLEDLSVRTQALCEKMWSQSAEPFEPETAFFRNGKIMNIDLGGEAVIAMAVRDPRFDLFNTSCQYHGAEYFSSISVAGAISRADYDEGAKIDNYLLLSVVGDTVGNRIVTISETNPGTTEHPIIGKHRFDLKNSGRIEITGGEMKYGGVLDPWPEVPSIN